MFLQLVHARVTIVYPTDNVTCDTTGQGRRDVALTLKCSYI